MFLPDPKLVAALSRVPDPSSPDGRAAEHARAFRAGRVPLSARLAAWLAPFLRTAAAPTARFRPADLPRTAGGPWAG